MALSNIFREPRREITETVVGLVLLVPAWADYRFGVWLATFLAPPDKDMYVMLVVVGTMLGVALMGAAVLSIVILHAVGESICDALEDRGMHLRPRQRR